MVPTLVSQLLRRPEATGLKVGSLCGQPSKILTQNFQNCLEIQLLGIAYLSMYIAVAMVQFPLLGLGRRLLVEGQPENLPSLSPSLIIHFFQVKNTTNFLFLFLLL